MVSPAVGYAASAMGLLALRGDAAIRVQEIAKAIGAPRAYLSKIIHVLAKKGYVTTVKGRGGGVRLGVDPRRTTLYDLCVALDDDILHPRCALGTAECSDERACPAHALQMAIRARQLDFLRKTTVQRVGHFNAERCACRPSSGLIASTKKGARA
jgi:Rrf2 family iron-sulfur cluster assembly transcriptional regulator